VVFWVNLPIGAAAIAMIAAFLHEDIERRPHRIDTLGSLLLALGISALMLVLIQRSDFDARTATAITLFGLLALAALLLHERRTAEPMLVFGLLRERVILIGSAGSGLAGAVMMGISAFLPAYVQGAMGQSAIMAGLVLGAMSVTWALASIFGGRLMVRTTYRLAAVTGALALIAGCALLVLLTPERGVPWATAGSLIIGIGMGFCNTAFIVSIQAAVAWNRRGAATSWCLFLRFIGQATGAAAFGAVLNATIAARAPGAAHLLDRLLEPAQRATLPEAERTQLIDLVAAGLHNAYWLGLALSIAALLLVIALPARLSPAQQPLR
jgi:MFS family permease